MRIAVFGANGFQGGLVVEELLRCGIEPVLIGRNLGRLREAAERLNASDAEVRVAEIDDLPTLAKAISAGDAVINCAGPFSQHGAFVVQAAIEARRPYVDTSGEQLYVKRLFDELAGRARDAGVAIVPAATDGNVPGDLIAEMIGRIAGEIDEIVVSHRIVGGGVPSRGTVRSVVQLTGAIREGGLGYEQGAWRSGLPLTRATMIFPGETTEEPIIPFPLAEVIVVPRHVKTRRMVGVLEASLGQRLSAPITPEMIDRLPRGPSIETRIAQKFTITLDATLPSGRLIRGVVQGPDTYGTTAIISVECARRLVGQNAISGVLAPAEVFEPIDLLGALAERGVSWRIEGD